MTTEEILIGNKLIGRFMDATVWAFDETHYNRLKMAVEPKDYDTIPEKYRLRFYYHSSWDSLMPVIKKVLDITFEDNSPFSQEDYNVIVDRIPDIQDTWKAVVEFIKQFNKEVHGK